MLKTIYIIGAGAIGKALAVFLQRSNQKVILIKGREGQAVNYHERINIKLKDQSTLSASIEITSINQYESLDGIVVISSKSFGNDLIANALKQKLGGTPVVIMQNGLDVERSFLDAGFAAVYRCVLFATSQFSDSTSISFKPVAPSPIGILAGEESQLEEVVNYLNTPWFSFRPEINIQLFIWKKVIANSVFNSICPLLNVDNGIFYRNESARALAARVVKECLVVAAKLGIALAEDDVMENILLISKASDGQLISTLQDIMNKRPTEIETLNFAIVKKAETLGLLSQVNETRLLGELVRLRAMV